MSLPTDVIPPPAPSPTSSANPAQTSRHAKGPGVPRPLPPEWPIEKFFLVLGKGPVAVKSILDRLATVAVLRPVMRFFSSVWVGILSLLLIGLYVGIGSGFASLRAKLEMTDLQFFDAWPMRILIAILAITLATVTIRRIPLTLYKAGVWTVHVGILTLLGGSVWYFSQKTEGSFRIYLNQTVGASYDVTERALYAYRMKPDGSPDLASETMTRLPGLPIYYEHLAKLGNPLNTETAPSVLGPLSPALKDASLKIVGYYPYANLQNEWMPADQTNAAPAASHHHGVMLAFSAGGSADGKWFVADSPAGRVYDGPQMPFSVEYVYHPTVQKLEDMEADIDGPAGLAVRIPKLNIDRVYTLKDATPFAVDGSRYTLTPGNQMVMSLASKGYEDAFSNILTVHVERKDPPPALPFSFDRSVLARYPEISPDFITLPDGKQKRIQERVDNDIQLSFLDAQRDEIWLVEHGDEEKDAAKKFEVIHRPANGGKVERMTIVPRTPVKVQVGTVEMHFNLMGVTDHAAEASVPRIVPPQQRDRGQTPMDAMQYSIIELAFSQGSVHGALIDVPFVQFAQFGAPPAGRPPVVINVPGAGQIGFIFSTTRRALPTTVKLSSFEAIKYPGASHGSRSYEDYVSHLEMTDKRTGHTRDVVARLNEPAADHGYYYFQSGWDGHDDASAGERFSILGVGNRPGLTTMVVGAILMIVGIGYSFYVKPLLLNAKKKSLAAWAAKQNP